MMNPMSRLPSLGLMGLALVLAACSGTAPTPTTAATATAPLPTTVATATPPLPSATSDTGLVTTPEAAVERVLAFEPRLVGIRPKDDDLIGQSAWYEVTPASGVGAFLVGVRVGWGDCPAGCIDEHTWQYAVAPDGTVTLQREDGDEPPGEAWPAAGQSGRTGFDIRAVAGPVCPVERPGDSACDPRPVPDAAVVIRDGSGAQVATVTLDNAGLAFVPLPPGDYSIDAAPVEGLMGTPAAISATLLAGHAEAVVLDYDTGIR